MELGYSLSTEETEATQLITCARRAEEVGFSFALISDHFHPWTDRQGQAPFVWSIIGAISQVTERLRLGTGVTCPLIRMHPAIVAQAAATSATIMPGRFFLGLGTGENLNEHVIGARWPEADVRLEMLEEAVQVIRLLWKGNMVSHRGRYYEVENARIYTRPSEPPPIYIAGAGPKSSGLAGKIGDGFISTTPNPENVKSFEAGGGRGKPTYGQMTVCWASDVKAARKTAREIWPTAGLGGELTQELKLPKHFEQATKTVREEDVASTVVCGPDPQPHIERIQEYEKAGFDHVYIHQIGPDQAGFFRFYEREVLPAFARSKAQQQPVHA